MKPAPALFALILALPACQMGLPSPAQAPVATGQPSSLSVPPITKDCSGPSRDNFNGARLTRAVIDQIPQQFDTDRQILRAVLAGRGTEEMRRFAQLCHGLVLG